MFYFSNSFFFLSLFQCSMLLLFVVRCRIVVDEVCRCPLNQIGVSTFQTDNFTTRKTQQIQSNNLISGINLWRVNEKKSFDHKWSETKWKKQQPYTALDQFEIKLNSSFQFELIYRMSKKKFNLCQSIDSDSMPRDSDLKLTKQPGKRKKTSNWTTKFVSCSFLAWNSNSSFDLLHAIFVYGHIYRIALSFLEPKKEEKKTNKNVTTTTTNRKTL